MSGLGLTHSQQQMVIEQANIDGVSVREFVRTAILEKVLRSPVGADAAPGPLVNRARIGAVRRTGLLDTARAPAFDRAVTVATQALRVPSAAVVLVDADRVFYLAGIGLSDDAARSRQEPASTSIAAHMVRTGRSELVVTDAGHDSALATLASIPVGVGGYLGRALADVDGHPIGVLSVWQNGSRAWTAGEIALLSDLGALVTTLVTSA